MIGVHLRARATALALLSVTFVVTANADAASITGSGTVTASNFDTGTYLFAVPTGGAPINVYGYGALDDGILTATSFTDLDSLVGIAPGDLSIRMTDLERVGTEFGPAGCSPVQGVPALNCATTTSLYGEADGSPAVVEIELAGVGTILSGLVLSATNTVDSDPSSPGFTTATATAPLEITSGLGPYLDEILALTGGSGRGTLELDRFRSVCTTGSDPCDFLVSGTLSFVPEPGTALLFGLGLAGLAVQRRATVRP